MVRKILVAKRGGEGGKKKKNASKQKGARWSKGHSCVSNPKTTKHREQVSGTFLHPVNAGTSQLTVKNLHNNRPVSVAGDSDDDTVLSSDVASLTISDGGMSILTTASSIRTIASGWSQISHNAFERFLRKFKGDIVAHKDMLSILAAASEVIGEAGGKKNETEFFATFMSLLNSCPPDQYQGVMSLVCIIIGKVSPAVLKLRFGDIYPKLGSILSCALENDEELLIRTTVEAIIKLLKVQDYLNFEEDKVLEGLLYSVIKCSLYDRPRVRRKVRQSVKSLINCYNEKKCSNMIPKVIIGWVLDQLACYPMCEPKTVANALTFLATSWNSIQKISFVGAKKLFEGVLRVMSSGDASIMKIGLSFFVVVFQSSVVISETSDDSQNGLNEKLVAALWELQPDWRNIETFEIWMTCILLGIVRSTDGSTTKATTSYLPLLFETLHPVWLTNYGKRVLRVLKEYLPHVVNSETDASIIDRCFQSLSKCYLIVPPNPFVLQATEHLLEQLSPDNFTRSAKEVLLQLTPLSQSSGVEPVLGKFVKAFGIEKIWSCCDSTIRWNVVMPLIKDNLNDANFLFWKKEMLTQIGKLGTPKLIWLAFIGFSRNPKDPENFPAELVGKVISDKPELRLQALAGLRQFIEWPQCKTIAVKYSKNYLPLLFNLYVQEKAKSVDNKNPGHANAIQVTIANYLPVCEDSFVNQLLEKAFTKLESSEAEEASAVHDLVAFLGAHVGDSKLQQKVLSVVESHFDKEEERKRIYRIMTFLAKNEALDSKNLEALYNLLCKNKGETKSNAAALRLECINVVTAKNQEWMKSFLSEIILNLISANAKAKRCAIKYVMDYCELVKENGAAMDEMMEVTINALHSTSPLLVSSTTFFIFLVFKELKPSSPNFDILSICLDNLNNSENPLVWKYSLSFLNLNLSLYKGQMGPLATLIGQIAGNSKYPRKEVNKILARMIKIFGAAGLRAVLPNAEDPKMRSRVKNLCRKLKKLKEESKSKSAKEDDEDEKDSDNESEDEFGQIKSESKPMVIKEGLVDFLNPREITQALVNEITPADKKDIEFKQSADGKLIIGNLEDDDDDCAVDNDNSDNDSDMDIDTIRMSKKRKSCSASVTSSKRSARTTKTSFSTKSSKKVRKSGAAGSRSIILSKKKKHSNSKGSVKSSSSSIVRFK